MYLYRFEWNRPEIKDQNSFQKFIKDMSQEDICTVDGYYDEVARLYYDDTKGNCVMIALAVPTYEWMNLARVKDVEKELPWLNGYRADNLYDEDIDYECQIYYGEDNSAANQALIAYENRELITYDSAEQIMLAFAKKLCECIK